VPLQCQISCNVTHNPLRHLMPSAPCRWTGGKLQAKLRRRLGAYFRHPVEHRDYVAVGTAAGISTGGWVAWCPVGICLNQPPLLGLGLHKPCVDQPGLHDLCKALGHSEDNCIMSFNSFSCHLHGECCLTANHIPAPAAFGAPIGGILFAVEQGTSWFSTRMLWHAVLAAGVALYVTVVLMVSPPPHNLLV
jgi:hypothetical protein